MRTLVRDSDLLLPGESEFPGGFDLRGLTAGKSFNRGYNTEGDVLTQTIDGRDLNEMWQEFQQLLQAWNADRTALVNALTFNVTNPTEDVPQVSMDDFELASEFGVPKGITGGDFFSMGYAFQWYDIAKRFTWKFLAEAQASQVEAINNQVLEADNRLVFKQVMKAIFSNTTRATNIRGQNYTVYPFYNADGTIPPAFKNYTFDGTENHYLISGAATVDSGDLDDMETKLVQHGYGTDGGATLILLVNRQQLQTIRNFRVASGSSYDYIPAGGRPPFLLPTNTGGIAGGTVPSEVNGLTVVGQYGNWLIVEENYIPVGYLVGFATGGRNQASNPVGIREHQNAGLRGLRMVKGATPDYPLIDSYYQRGFGTGIRHRGAGVVMQVKASGTYDIPAAYAS